MAANQAVVYLPEVAHPEDVKDPLLPSYPGPLQDGDQELKVGRSKRRITAAVVLRKTFKVLFVFVFSFLAGVGLITVSCFLPNAMYPHQLTFCFLCSHKLTCPALVYPEIAQQGFFSRPEHDGGHRHLPHPHLPPHRGGGLPHMPPPPPFPWRRPPPHALPPPPAEPPRVLNCEPIQAGRWQNVTLPLGSRFEPVFVHPTLSGSTIQIQRVTRSQPQPEPEAEVALAKRDVDKIEVSIEGTGFTVDEAIEEINRVVEEVENHLNHKHNEILAFAEIKAPKTANVDDLVVCSLHFDHEPNGGVGYGVFVSTGLFRSPGTEENLIDRVTLSFK